ncbi:hypothetical protein [Streptomyces sp. NPDC101150]|uniref:hypothetical protein n=1 Tax=Streptomyces sp. NPDC101150 TaxID=3366114 RepID=UPI00382F6430
MQGRGFRAVRAALFSALCVTLSAASHVLLSHAPLPPATLAAVCAGVFAAAYALTGRERGYGAVAALLVPLELAADTVFTTGQHACYGPAGGPVVGALHSVGVDLLCRGGELGAPLVRMAALAHGPAGTGGSGPWLLLAAHLAVGLLAAAWLHRGDAALQGLLRAVAASAFRSLPRVPGGTANGPCPGRPGRGLPRPPLPARPLPLLVHCVLRRGPPPAAAR